MITTDTHTGRGEGGREGGRREGGREGGRKEGWVTIGFGRDGVHTLHWLVAVSN